MPPRTRSFWAWGWADRFPAPEARQNMGQMLSQMLGFGELSLLDPPELSKIELPASRIQTPSALQDLNDPSRYARASHTYGRAYVDIVRGFHGDFSSAPDLVLRPRTEAELERALEVCDQAKIAVVPFGGGTSVVRGVECKLQGALLDRFTAVASLDLGGLDQVLEVDAHSRLIRAQAGIMGPALEAQLKPHGLTLRHYPQSFEFSSLGGWLATRAGGHFATLYTHIDELVAGMRSLSPRGWLDTRPLPGSGAGPSADRLLLGSEGALGIITEATMRVRCRPRFKASATVHFQHFKDAVEAARLLAQSDLYPTNCRLLDAREASLNMVAQGANVLIVGFESNDHSLEPWLQRALQITDSQQGQTQSSYVRDESQEAQAPADGAGQWRAAFIQAPYLQSAAVSMGVLVDTFETACTWSRFFEMHEAIVEGVRAAMKPNPCLLTCRFTHVYPDGPAPYYTFLTPARVGDELSQWRDIKAAASELLISHGATITHHHAVGRTHRPWYQKQVSPVFLEALQGAKNALDPRGILNPGVLLKA